MSRSGRRTSRATKRVDVSARIARGAAGVSLFLGLAAGAFAQQDDGMIAIPGNAETNPAAVTEMANSLKAASASSKTPAPTHAPVAPAALAAVQYSQDNTRPSGYRAATQAADAAMRNAALALESRVEAADDSSDDASGMIVIPGAGQAKMPAVRPQAAAPAVSAVSAVPANGMMKASFSPNTAAATAAVPAAKAAASRDVTPVIVNRDDTNAASARPVAAGTANPVSNAAIARRPAMAPQPVAQPPQQASANFQDGESIRVAALNFLQQQATGLPGKVDITVTPVFPRGLAPCSALDPFMPTGARLWGRVTVGVRCVGERPWTLYVQARIAINATYYMAARAIAPGEVLTNADLVARDGDLTSMPQAVVTDPAQAVGATALSRIGANLPLRSDMLRASSAVSVGQSVHVVADGEGFAISAEGSVMNNASPGQQVRVKTAGGQIITGIVKDSQTVEIRL
jgi:flagellar basal body P-ring formation protein FlgA